MDFNIKNKVVLVTGGSRGIGRAICLQYAKEHAHVAVNYAANAQAAEDTVKAIQAAGGRAHAFQADVRIREQVDGMFGKIKASLGSVDILVNNAGHGRGWGVILDINSADWDEQMAVHLRGAYNCIQNALPDMKSNTWGRIINTTSYTTHGLAVGHHYIAAKSGLVGLTRSLALELAPFGITVNAVSPGAIYTDMLKSGTPAGEKIKAMFADKVPLGRIGEPEDVAAAACFLGSQQADYITGIDLNVSGGLVI